MVCNRTSVMCRRSAPNSKNCDPGATRFPDDEPTGKDEKPVQGPLPETVEMRPGVAVFSDHTT